MNFLSNKVFAKQNKHRGLQKLKYYCEMCSRQCKDENGFKCHTQSEQHKRNMELFTSNPRLFIEKFSYEFEKSFLDLLRMQYSNKKVLANKLYKDFISDKDHTHMNSTKWSTLSGFLNYLKSTGKITIEETEKGPLIEYLDQSPQAIDQRKNEERKLKEDKSEAKKREKETEKLTTMIDSNKNKKEQINPINDKKDLITKKADAINLDQEFKFSFEMKSNKQNKEGNIFNEKKDSKMNENQENEVLVNLLQKKRIGSNLDRLFKHSDKEFQTQEIEEYNQDNLVIKIEIQNLNEDYPWVHPNLIVRIKDKELKNGEYFNKKAKIIQIIDEFVAELEVLDNKAKIKIDQLLLEAVIPAINSSVIILCGDHKWEKGKLIEINLKEKYVIVEKDNQQLYIAINGICKI